MISTSTATIWLLLFAFTSTKLLQIDCLLSRSVSSSINFRKLVPPIVINTWNFTSANKRAWQELKVGHSSLDAIEFGCSQCEFDRCDGTVGWGGSPSETGETTLDAMLMDGETYDVGAVGGLRRVKSAISVARLVLERTNHSLLVGEMATQFAIELGFKEESLKSKESEELHKKWLANSCQPNYWKNVEPDPRTYCGPYHLIPLNKSSHAKHKNVSGKIKATNQNLQLGHDTIGMIAIDSKGRVASGTSTNGLRNKILGRVGDSPVAGAGSYAAGEVGAAAATGDGDVIMRFLLSYQAVENLRQGMRADLAARDVIERQTKRTGRPYAQAAVIVLAKDGSFGAACSGISGRFPFVTSDSLEQTRTYQIECLN